MRILRPASEAGVVATFLRAEIESARWGDKLRDLLREDGVEESVLAHPDVAADRIRAGLVAGADLDRALPSSCARRHRRPGWVCVRLLRGQNAVELLDAVERGEECEE